MRRTKKAMSFLAVSRKAFTNLKANDPIRMAAATAFFTFFALPPIAIILSHLYGGLLLGDTEWISGQLFRKMAELVGRPSARELKHISVQLQQPKNSPIAAIISLLVLFLASTTLFIIIKNSLNQLWNVRVSARGKWWLFLLDKLIALGVIIFSGFLFTASLLIHRALITLLHEQHRNGSNLEWLRVTLQHSLSIIVLTIWFGIVFKYLPDIRIRWKAVWVGGLVTAILIDIGEVILDHVLINSPVSESYGSAGALILVLLFVFYCSLIFYYGASFTRQYAQLKHIEAKPGANSVAYQIKEVTPPKNLG